MKKKILGIIGILLIGYFSSKLLYKYELTKYNKEYIDFYFANSFDNCEVLDRTQEYYIPGFIDGGHYEYCTEDKVAENYRDSYTIYDKDVDFNYSLVFEHKPLEKIKLVSDDKQHYLANKRFYEMNYQLIADIIEENGGTCEKIGTYREDELGKYIIIAYVPNFEAISKIDNKGCDLVYGGYMYGHLNYTNNIPVYRPRYIFTNNKDVYDSCIQNKSNVELELKSKLLDCKETTTNREDILYTSHMVDILMGISNMENTLYTNFTELEDVSTKWIITWEWDDNCAYFCRYFDLAKGKV